MSTSETPKKSKTRLSSSDMEHIANALDDMKSRYTAELDITASLDKLLNLPRNEGEEDKDYNRRQEGYHSVENLISVNKWYNEYVKLCMNNLKRRNNKYLDGDKNNKLSVLVRSCMENAETNRQNNKAARPEKLMNATPELNKLLTGKNESAKWNSKNFIDNMRAYAEKSKLNYQTTKTTTEKVDGKEEQITKPYTDKRFISINKELRGVFSNMLSQSVAVVNEALKEEKSARESTLETHKRLLTLADNNMYLLTAPTNETYNNSIPRNNTIMLNQLFNYLAKVSRLSSTNQAVQPETPLPTAKKPKTNVKS